MKINDVNTDIEKYRPTKRLGRGIGSGQGKTAGRGHKGQYSRSGSPQSLVFQGGTMPLFRRIPKRGFTNKFAFKVGEVNIRDLELAYQDGEEVTPENLRAHDLAKYRYDVLKVLGTGELTKKLTVRAHRFSAAAKEKIERAGGKVVLLPMPQPVVKNRKKSPRTGS
ncbi:MAG TPA: 50S ribosomal protein L15 [Pirellulaceae bacterium]|nr:50S ribosomal protein L15 [Pirellulaceae bacterium]